MTCDINQLVIALQEKRREILTCPSDSPQLAKLRLEQERLFARLFPKIQALIHKLVQREYERRKDFPLLVSEIDDFVQEATVAMLKAIDDFDPSRGVKFTTMLYRYVKTKINDAIRKETKFKPQEEGEEAEPIIVVSTSKPIGKTDEGDTRSRSTTRSTIKTALRRVKSPSVIRWPRISGRRRTRSFRRSGSPSLRPMSPAITRSPSSLAS